MKKIAILGVENSHADAFLSFIREKEEFADIEVIGVYSNEPEAMEKTATKFGVPAMQDYSDALGKIDALVITARHGDNHYKYAKPYIESGIPMFIDKPITVKEAEAVEFMRGLRDNGVRITGGSSLKQDDYIIRLKKDAAEEVDGKTLGGLVRAPYKSNSPYGGFYFYAQHLVEMVTEIYGRYPISVTARKNGDQIHVLFHYENYDCVGLFTDKSRLYYASRMAENGTSSYDIPTTNDWFYREFKEFHELLNGGEQKTSYEDFIAPVFIMNAIDRSLASGKEEAVAKAAL